MNIAFLYNVRHRYPDPKKPKTLREADFDDPETTELQIKYLKKLGYKIFPIEANEQAYFKLYRLKNKIDLVFNVSEGLHGNDREAQIPAMLEMLQIPYTGSPPLTQAIILNKSKTKEILIANKIPTLRYQLLTNKNDKLNKSLKYPLMVKPVSEGSSAGITNKSVVYSEVELYKQVDYIFKTFNEQAMVEPYLAGREFSVAMLGNPPQVLPILESDHSILPKKYMPFDSLEVKWFYELATGGKHLKCPAKITFVLEKKINKICLELWDVLGIRDWCRIDIRCDEKDNPYVLEVNSPPGCTPPEHDPASYFPLIARSIGIDYENLLKKIIETALKRYKK
ncbi:D-alanine--D-alanine ligase [Candidatus Roizmanbacteria bacterium CG_4_9_14_3_um_filter_33_18]|uniref:D-alanine--D-alanine ligase n=3 Tax=Candidatus Roizmaniibacteriota TaxID=1752723 RepID=A0A2M7U6T7_9BACT|nr:MAG: D-alanine--D-alanine ligase [Candidatus Roizmanbacteria bacterium CG22_combo_CG10-13_8_21_14_all_34_12]PIZ66938.1 MAG: D-alanine--D-alanine ligase [Candidatus Roizmanbacteria bacterium CG_4_10_14_0_2_um_filter_33_96]PJA55692.1 MAG: D-alanine--D-alanine ligase [Candidatus Roizmanbacteria bacterium CG_4_9_14_3_um_filter_33_18]